MSSNSNRKLARGMILVLFANIISMVINVLLNLIQPKYLSVDTYVYIKTFALYMNYAGLFHLGYVDGMYLKYGGKETREIDKSELGNNVSTARIFQFIVSILVFLAGTLASSPLLRIFGIFLLPYNMTIYYRLLFQATGEFSLYGKMMNAFTFLLFAINMVLIFWIRTDDYVPYLLSYIISYLIIWIILEVYLNKKINVRFRLLYFSLKEFVESIKSGFFITFGNLSSNFLTGMDRWFVKFLLPNADFAYYSFAVSIENMVNVVVTPFTVTLYNYFCVETDNAKIIKMRDFVTIFSILFISIAFPVKFFIEIWIPNYLESVDVIFYLFGAQVFFIIVKSIYVNLYQARKEQKTYFIKLMICLFSGVIFNALFFLLLRNKEAMAIGTLLSSALWFVLCQFDFRSIHYRFRHYLYLTVEILLFLLTGNLTPAVPGFFVYLGVSLLLSFVLMKKETLAFFAQIRSLLRERGLFRLFRS